MDSWPMHRANHQTFLAKFARHVCPICTRQWARCPTIIHRCGDILGFDSRQGREKCNRPRGYANAVAQHKNAPRCAITRLKNEPRMIGCKQESHRDRSTVSASKSLHTSAKNGHLDGQVVPNSWTTARKASQALD